MRETKGRVQFQKLKFNMPVCSCLRGNKGSTLFMSSQGSMKLLKQSHLVPPERLAGVRQDLSKTHAFLNGC